jgi:hypothetical protein
LKIDTEGSDFDVLIGCGDMLVEHCIDIIQLESGMNSKNTWHVQFDRFKEYLELKSYYLFGIYEQVSEWRTLEPHLRRANLVFVSQEVIVANRGSHMRRHRWLKPGGPFGDSHIQSRDWGSGE